MNMRIRVVGAIAALVFPTGVFAQGLLEQAAAPQAPAAPQTPSAATPAAPGSPEPASAVGSLPQKPPTPGGFSLFGVVAAQPRSYVKHDLVEIIINESSLQKFEQTADMKKNSSLTAELSRFPSLKDLAMDATLGEGIGAVKPGLGVKSDNKYKGEGKFNRKDQITAKITATIIDVKPNGNLVLEARETIQTDKEITTMVISGTCRGEDISRSNTVQSSQIANMNLRIEHEGDVKNSAEKGIIPRVFEAIFNF